jgi:hypothetical protein
MKKSFLLIIGLAAMLLFAPACLEDFFSTDEEEDLSQDLVGVWHRIYMTIDGVQYGLPSVVYLNDDGSGTGDGFDEPEQEEPGHNVFTWEIDDNIMTVTNENDSIIWSGEYTLSEDNNVVQFNYTSDGHSYQEVYVKYTGEKDTALTGDWALVELNSGGERQLMLEKVSFAANGTGTDYLVEDLEESTEAETGVFTWTTTGDYLIVISQGEQCATVVQYNISGDVFTGTSYSMDGEQRKHTLL